MKKLVHSCHLRIIAVCACSLACSLLSISVHFTHFLYQLAENVRPDTVIVCPVAVSVTP